MSDYYDVNAISNSSLSCIDPTMGGSPKKFKNFLEKNYEKKNSVSLERGTLLHSWIEKPDEFVVSDIVKPSEKVCEIIEHIFNNYAEDWVISEKEIICNTAKDKGYGKNWKDDTLYKKVWEEGGREYYEFLASSDGKICVDAATANTLRNCQQSILENDAATALLMHPEALKELEVYWTWEGLDLKAKIDCLIIDHENKVIKLVDLKTTYSAYGFKKSFEEWKYYRQLAFYSIAVTQYLIENYAKKDIDLSGYDVRPYIVAVETKAPFSCVVYEVDDSYLDSGLSDAEILLRKLQWHYETDVWHQSKEEYENGGVMKLSI